ncbi:MAG: hypothetical protein KDH92_12920, partial [Chloroflexi bacterium]|nr:hypothetical protein [Chloroflexota bacterium]
MCWVDVWLRIDPGLVELYLEKGGVRTDLMVDLEPLPPVAVAAGPTATPVGLARPLPLGIHDRFSVRWTGRDLGAPHYLDRDHVGLYVRPDGSLFGERYRRAWANPSFAGEDVTFGFSYQFKGGAAPRTVERLVLGDL